jgi:hypothetical protein
MPPQAAAAEAASGNPFAAEPNRRAIPLASLKSAATSDPRAEGARKS